MTNAARQSQAQIDPVWFVTGSSRGLGRAIVDEVAKAGHRVVATARNVGDLADFVARYGDRVRALPLDVTDPVAAERAVADAIAAFGRIDVLVNNAGYGDTASIEDISLDAFRRQIDTNFYGVVHTTRAALPHMRIQGAGRILQISSIGGRRGGTPGLGAYQAAKFAVAGFSEVLINEVAALGIQVTIVEPGGFATDWAGPSMTIFPTTPAYEATVGMIATAMRGNPATGRGVPERAAKALLALASMERQPRRLLLGTDAYALADATLRELAENDEANRVLTASTDADGLGDFADSEIGRVVLGKYARPRT